MTVHGDIRDTYQLNRVVRDQNTDRIIHRASLKVPASVADPPTAVAVVAGGLINVLEAARLSL